VRVVISLTGVAAVTFVAYRLIPVNATTVGFGYPRPPSCATHFFGSLPKYQDGVSVQCFFYEVVCSGIFFRLDVGRNLQHGVCIVPSGEQALVLAIERFPDDVCGFADAVLFDQFLGKSACHRLYRAYS